MFQLTRALRSMLIVLLCGAVMSLAGSAAPAIAEDDSERATSHVRFHIRAPNEGALQQIYQLLRQRQYRSAKLLTKLILVPQAT